jgi:hypothetical protein
VTFVALKRPGVGSTRDGVSGALSRIEAVSNARRSGWLPAFCARSAGAVTTAAIAIAITQHCDSRVE